MAHARTRLASLRLGWVSIDTRRCAALSDTASSVALDALTCGRVFQPRAPSEKSANACLQSGHSAVWDRPEGSGCAADTGLPRLNEDMPVVDEGRAFLAISLLSTRDITSLTALSRMALVRNCHVL